MARATQPASPVTAFNEAVWRHDDAAIARLAPRIDPNTVDRWQRAPLAMAAQYGELATVRRLLARGARPDADRRYLTPITYAARRGARDIVDALRDAGATVSIATSIYLGDRAAVSRALASISDGQLDKVVLAREVGVVADSPFSPREVVTRLISQQPGCFVYATEGFVGASPELLVRRRDHDVESRPVAGTAIADGDQSRRIRR